MIFKNGKNLKLYLKGFFSKTPNFLVVLLKITNLLNFSTTDTHAFK